MFFAESFFPSFFPFPDLSTETAKDFFFLYFELTMERVCGKLESLPTFPLF